MGKKPRQKRKPQSAVTPPVKKGKKAKAGHVRASHILVKKFSLAEDLIDDIKTGADFAKLAREHSECPSKKRGGDLGEFRRGEMAKPFEDAVYKAKIGELVGPIKTQHGYHIIKRTG